MIDSKIVSQIKEQVPDMNKCVRIIYNRWKDEIDNIFLFLMFEKENRREIRFYSKILLDRLQHTAPGSDMSDLVEAVDFIKDYHTVESIKADFYILFNKAMSKYIGLRRPRSNINYFIEKNMEFLARDWFSAQFTMLRTMRNEAEFGYTPEPSIETSVPLSFVLDGWIDGIGNIDIPSHLRHALYLKINYQEKRFDELIRRAFNDRQVS